MTDRALTAFLIRLTMAQFLAWVVTTTRAQEVEPLKDVDISTDRSSISVPGKKTQPLQRTEEVKSARSEASRWERFRDSVWHFRPKRDLEPTSGQDKRRSLLGEKVKYAPGEGAEFPEFSPMKADTAVSPTKRETTQEAPPPAVPRDAANTLGRPAQVGSTVTPSNEVPPLDPLPTPTPEQPGSYGVGEAVAEAALSDSTTPQNEQEPYGLGKRFLRGYPTLILWFPGLLGPHVTLIRPPGRRSSRG